MGHEEEDKELMMIRMETLKSMIGKLKNKTSQSNCKEGNQSSLNGNKSYLERKKLLDTPRPSTLTGQSSPPIHYNRSCIKSKSNPTSPLASPNRSRDIVMATTPSPLLKTRNKLNDVMNTASVTTGTNTINSSSSSSSNGTRTISNNQIFTKVESSSQLPPSKASKTIQTLLKPSTLHIATKSLCSPSKSYSDSEISSRKSLFKHVESSLGITQPVSKQIFITNTNHTVGSPSSQQSATNGLSRSLLKTDKNTVLHTNTSTLINLQKLIPASTTTTTITKPLTKFVKRSSTHTITKPVTNEVTKTITNTSLNSTNTQPLISSVTTTTNSTLAKSDLSKPGKILFERTGKVLFDRHASTQQNKRFVSNTNLNILSKGSSTVNNNKTQNFAHEFQLIRKKHVITNNKPHHQKATTRTKFYSSDYVPPEMCEKARTILSKYKVVRQKENCIVDNRTKKDINANYSPLPSRGCSPITVPGKVLFQRYQPSQGRGNAISNYVYLKKGKAFYPARKIMGNSYRNFVSRRIKYMKSVDPNPFSLQVKPSLEGNNLHNKQAKKEIILSRHGTNYKVAGNLKSLRRLSQGQKFKDSSPVKPTVCNGNSHNVTTSNSKLTTKNVSVKQYAASQVLKKTRLTVRKKITKDKYCLFYNRFGKCKRGEECHFIHDPEKIAICTRFLRGTCKDESCSFSHKLDPDKMPVCSYFLRGECGRDDCPYRHVNVGESASICDDFLKGYCPSGKECVKKHILECEEFCETGRCSKGKSCILAHRQHTTSKRKYSGSRPPKGFRPKHKKVGSHEEDEPNEEDVRPNEGKKHMLPKFISEKIKLLRDSTSEKPTSFSGIKKFYESTETDKDSLKENTNDLWGSDFIPLSNYSGGESDDESSEFIQRMFTFKK